MSHDWHRTGANHVVFTSRTQAGILLSAELIRYKRPQTVAIGLSRGGVIVARAIADKLTIPLDVLVIKKVPAPHDPEYAIGAAVSDGSTLVRWPQAQRVGADEKYILDTQKKLTGELKRKDQWYRRVHKAISVRNRPVIIIDDGAATGLTMQAAIAWARKRNVTNITVALPVASPETYRQISALADACVVLAVPDDMTSVGKYYKEFAEVSDDEVAATLAGAEESGLV